MSGIAFPGKREKARNAERERERCLKLEGCSSSVGPNGPHVIGVRADGWNCISLLTTGEYKHAEVCKVSVGPNGPHQREWGQHMGSDGLQPSHIGT